ncbi:MAG TPA: glycoside hydrolase family 18 protein [Terracidiphilus sp.]
MSLFLFAAAAAFPASHKSSSQLVAYVFPRDAAIAPGQIDPHIATRFNYAFANIADGQIVTGTTHDAENFVFLTSLRHDNPKLTVLISVGGWLWSGKFSDMALTKKSRARFIQSAVDFVKQYNLDGLDIDWEYPGLPGATQAFRPEDKQNFTALLSELRTAFNRESKQLHRKLYITIAAGSSNEFLAHTEMSKVARIVDMVNLMSYDYYEPGDGAITGHNSPLYANPQDPAKASSDSSVRAFEAAGVPPRKLTLGVPLYGHTWAGVADVNHGLFQPGKPAPNGWFNFGMLPSSLEHGFTRTWDPSSRVPTLYNKETQTFISYEDEQSIAGKCQYVHQHKLAGIMIWDLEDDDASSTLMKAINAGLQ